MAQPELELSVSARKTSRTLLIVCALGLFIGLTNSMPKEIGYLGLQVETLSHVGVFGFLLLLLCYLWLKFWVQAFPVIEKERAALKKRRIVAAKRKLDNFVKDKGSKKLKSARAERLDAEYEFYNPASYHGAEEEGLEESHILHEEAWTQVAQAIQQEKARLKEEAPRLISRWARARRGWVPAYPVVLQRLLDLDLPLALPLIVIGLLAGRILALWVGN